MVVILAIFTARYFGLIFLIVYDESTIPTYLPRFYSRLLYTKIKIVIETVLIAIYCWNVLTLDKDLKTLIYRCGANLVLENKFILILVCSDSVILSFQV